MPWVFNSSDGDALDALLAELDRLDEGGNRFAQNYAADIRRRGEPAIQKALAKCVSDVMQCTAWLTVTAVIAAFARYDRAVTGRDWGAIPHELTRARMATAAVHRRLADAQRHRAETMARIAERQGSRTLDALRSHH